ncbi:hypothetical protein ABKN59_010460 [Abortiporus biennis]
MQLKAHLTVLLAPLLPLPPPRIYVRRLSTCMSPLFYSTFYLILCYIFESIIFNSPIHILTKTTKSIH